MIKKLRKVLNDFGYWLYHKLRKKHAFDPDLVKYIPFGAIGSVFGKNPATQTYQYLKTGMKGSPTHSFIYVGGGKHAIAEADVYFSFNKLERYKDSKVVLHWFRNLTSDEMQELKDRIYTMVHQKVRYDLMGYLGFATRELEKLGFNIPKILKESDKLPFCSEAVQMFYSGDPGNDSVGIRDWTVIKKISHEKDPSNTTPADIYLFMEELRKKNPAKIGRLVLESKKKEIEDEKV